jgi:hypothetical protein
MIETLPGEQEESKSCIFDEYSHFIKPTIAFEKE